MVCVLFDTADNFELTEVQSGLCLGNVVVDVSADERLTGGLPEPLEDHAQGDKSDSQLLSVARDRTGSLSSFCLARVVLPVDKITGVAPPQPSNRRRVNRPA